MNQSTKVKNGMIRSAKEVARTAVFVAAVIGTQYLFSAVPFVEFVTVLFACYAYTPTAARAYFVGSLPFMAGQSACAGVTVGLLFFPLTKALSFVKKR